jgi:hypothetical protein
LRRSAFSFEAERRWLAAAFAQGVFCGSLFWRFISFEAPVIAGTSVLPVPKYAFAGPGGVLPLLTSLLAPPGLPLPALDMPVPPPPAANAKLGIKISATVAKDLSFIAFLRVLDVERDARQRARGGDVPRSGHAGMVRKRTEFGARLCREPDVEDEFRIAFERGFVAREKEDRVGDFLSLTDGASINPYRYPRISDWILAFDPFDSSSMSRGRRSAAHAWRSPLVAMRQTIS